MPHRRVAKDKMVDWVISRLLLEIMKSAAKNFLGVEYPASAADEVMLCAAVHIGQCEGRRMSSGKLAEYAGMPRATATRKLRELKERGLLDLDDQGRWCLATSSPEIQGRVDASIDALLPLIHRAAAELSKMDSGDIAARGGDILSTKQPK